MAEAMPFVKKRLYEKPYLGDLRLVLSSNANAKAQIFVYGTTQVVP
jgi:hypothetical protein